jgi:6-phosphogluconolactonase (cycloisomerase 2 family)
MTGFTVDAAGRLYVGYSAVYPQIDIYARVETGLDRPAATIRGSHTGLDYPLSMTVDGAGRLYVLNGGSITVYAAGATGDAAPVATIAGANTGFNRASGIALDAAGQLYVTNTGDSSVKIYAAGATGNATPMATIAGSNTRLVNPQRPGIDAAGRLYVINGTYSTPSYVMFGREVVVFAAGATGNATPAAILAGASTGLNHALGVALDAGGQLYVNNAGGDPAIPGVPYTDRRVTVYAAGATGDVAPTATIIGTYGWLGRPHGIARDAGGRLYVANGRPYHRIIVYPAGATGDATATDSIAGSNTGLNDPQGIAFDARGRLYVANAGDSSVRVFAAGATGNATPVATIAGSNTGLASLVGIAVDQAGQCYVANRGSPNPDWITVFAAGATGNATPKATIVGANTGLNEPWGVAVDQAGQLYVANESSASVTVYAPGATGNAAPVATIAGSNTWLAYPRGLALDPAGWLYVVNYGGTHGLIPQPSHILRYRPGATGNAVPAAAINLFYDDYVSQTFITF